MKYERAYLEELADKWENGTITPEEAGHLLDWYNSHNDMQAEVRGKHVPAEQKLVEQALRSALLQIAAEGRLAQQRAPSDRWDTYRIWIPAAAAILLLVFGGLFFSIRNEDPAVAVTEQNAVISPGGNRATLTMESGQSIELDSLQEGIRMSGHEIAYTDGRELGTADTAGNLVLSTPKGGTYQVTLSDGSKVYLNAATTLTYPGRFSSETRTVEIAGEAYFEVNQTPAPVTGRKGTKPFIVKSNGQEVQVLGTSFNISAYPDDNRLTTTLVSGSVKVTSLSSSKLRSLVLQPGEQAMLDVSAQTFERQLTDPAFATAWKDGRFSFDHKSFDQIMTEMARWYDLQVIYEGPVPTEHFMGGAFRNSNLSIVLALLESAHISYEVTNDRTIRIRNTANTK